MPWPIHGIGFTGSTTEPSLLAPKGQRSELLIYNTFSARSKPRETARHSAPSSHDGGLAGPIPRPAAPRDWRLHIVALIREMEGGNPLPPHRLEPCCSGFDPDSVQASPRTPASTCSQLHPSIDSGFSSEPAAIKYLASRLPAAANTRSRHAARVSPWFLRRSTLCVAGLPWHGGRHLRDRR